MSVHLFEGILQLITPSAIVQVIQTYICNLTSPWTLVNCIREIYARPVVPTRLEIYATPTPPLEYQGGWLKAWGTGYIQAYPSTVYRVL